MNIGIIGFGYWGTNIVRNFANLPGCTLKIVVDSRKERREYLNNFCPTAKFSMDSDEVVCNPEIDAVVIVTPVFTHYELALKALTNDKHVLVEKPMATNSRQAQMLIDLAERKQKTLMVDHTYLYTSAVQRMKTLIINGDIGNIKYFDSTRINLGLFQPDLNVLWDLAPHDISILNYLVPEKPYSVQATGISHTRNGIENIAYLTINYNSNLIAHINCSWTSPVKIRMLLVGGDKKMIVFNDLEPTEKIKVYDTRYDHKTDEDRRKILVDYRTGDIYIPKIENRDALSLMATDFISSITNGCKPLSDYQVGLDVLKILEASQISIKDRGKEVLIK